MTESQKLFKRPCRMNRHAGLVACQKLLKSMKRKGKLPPQTKVRVVPKYFRDKDGNVYSTRRYYSSNVRGWLGKEAKE